MMWLIHRMKKGIIKSPWKKICQCPLKSQNELFVNVLMKDDNNKNTELLEDSYIKNWYVISRRIHFTTTRQKKGII